MQRHHSTFIQLFVLVAIGLSTVGSQAAVLFEQRSVLYGPDRGRGVNWQSEGGVPLSDTAGLPEGSNGQAPSSPVATVGQFQGVVAYGAVTVQRTTNLDQSRNFPANARNLEWPHTETANSDVALVLRAQVGATYMMKPSSILFGGPIPVPLVDADGGLLSLSQAKNYWAPEPVTNDGHADTGYYWSPHAETVYAVQPGTVELTWRRAAPEAGIPNDLENYTQIGGNYFLKFPTNYLVSGATFKVPKKIFWTEKSFQSVGKPVQVPSARVGAVNVVYQNAFPERVAEEYVALGQSEITTSTNRLQELRTLWFDRTDGRIHAYNREGRVFVELLGDVRSGEVREQLGYEIVDVVQQAIPADVAVELGEEVVPPDLGGAGPALLFPEPLVSDLTKNFAFQHSVSGSAEVTYYATRETENLNDYQVYWMEEGVAGLRWPSVLGRYQLVWPSAVAQYSHYLRPNVNRATAEETAVPLPTDNAPIIEWQDVDAAGQPRAFLTDTFEFYTHLDLQLPVHRSLIRLTGGDNVAFERVLSWLDTSVKSGSYGSTDIVSSLDVWDDGNNAVDFTSQPFLTRPRTVVASAWVGQRLEAPDQEARTDGEGLYLAGSIREEIGDGYSVTAYQNPFAVGFEAAAAGSIIPVNAGNDDRQLEVWWYRKNSLNSADGFRPIYWPSVIATYNLVWPTTTPHAREIILASNDGSGPLTSLEAKGAIYAQNDPTLPGYNPNEEHALMQGGQAFALRDDLNVTSAVGFSSRPYVLLEYVDGDGRPNMSVFQVMREKPEEGIVFDYPLIAGQVMQPPMPLPLMEKPFGPRVVGEPEVSLNQEITSWLVTTTTATSGTIDSVELTTTLTHRFKAFQALSLQDVLSTGIVQNSSWLFPTNVNYANRSLIGFAANERPRSLALVNGQPASGTDYQFELASLPASLATGSSVVVAAAGSDQTWLGTVTSTATLSGQAVVDVSFGSTLTPVDDLAGALTLVQPVVVVADEFNGWRLGPQSLLPTISDGDRRSFLSGFTLQDRKGDVWGYRGPHSIEDSAFMFMQFYYKTLPGFYFPGVDPQPALGTITPYLRTTNGVGGFQGSGVDGDANNDGVGDRQALSIRYQPKWPDGVPVLQMAETLTLPKRGMAAVRGQRSLEIAYQQSQAQPNASLADRSAILHDPTRAKIFELGSPDDTNLLNQIPVSIKTSDFRGKTYFPNLPPHLSERFYFDPTRGPHGALVYEGEFIDSPVGDDFLLLNVLGQKDLSDLKGLCLGTDEDKGRWDVVIDSGLETVMERFVEDETRPGTFIASNPQTVGPTGLAEVTDDDVAVDSYALTAIGPGLGYVTLISGNGHNSDNQPVEEPVSLQIVRVVDDLYRGELKIVESSNPLAEKLTLQQVVDLGGKVEDFEFEWKIASPVDGQPVPVYQNSPQLLFGAGAWNHLHFPLVGETAASVNETTIPIERRAGDVNGSVMAVSRILFAGVTVQDSLLYFTGGNLPRPVAGNQVVVRYQDGTEMDGVVVDPPVAQAPGTVVVRLVADPIEGLPVIDLYEGKSVARPESIAFQTFTLDRSMPYSQFYLSLDVDPSLGVKVFIDGALAVVANLGEEDTAEGTAPGDFNPLSKVYRLGPELFAGGVMNGIDTDHQLTVEFFSDALPDVSQVFNLRIEGYQVLDLASAANSNWLPMGASQFEDKIRAIIGENADVRALSDNYIISRYRTTNTSHVSYRPDVNGEKQGWSLWTEPQLAEGWIKRVLAGINPFNQRVTDLFNNRVNTDVSILGQAGPRWEGDVALNLDSINDAGLIEIYETVLRRGKSLSIESGINFGPANDALLLAAGYLNDLYMILGNEAWADAANPTIGIGTMDRNFGDIATALFAFKGQMPSLLEEELALLRGRDDFLVPGVETRPVYNRLYWNYTRGIDSGEVIYALNYNILENNDSGVDGTIDADDARKLFPQGHGDAYGHYLTALKGYYSLLLDTDFDWVPRIEAVTILGKPVSVDYQDERKFASAAAAVARAGKQVFDLTARKDYLPGEDSGWEHFSNNRVNNTRLQPVPRMWGMDHWASRVGQGAYLNWAMGNAILPDVDPDPTHEGIQKVDRTTVPELTELATMASDLQTSLDNAEAHLTPLGLAEGSLTFDFNPSQVAGAGSKTHFEQVYSRAEQALRNAVVAFDDAKEVTGLLRSEQDSIAELQSSIGQQELAYDYQLIELYGTPYSDDIGPGRTYPQGYTGADLIHYSYAELPESILPDPWVSPAEDETFVLEVNDLPETFQDIVLSSPSEFQRGVEEIEFHLGPHGFFGKPEHWQGRRASPGRIQQAVSEIIASHSRLRQSLDDATGASEDWVVALNYLVAKNATKGEIRSKNRELLIAEEILHSAKLANTLFEVVADNTKKVALKSGEVIEEAIPDNIVAGLAAGGDLASGAKSALKTAGLTIETGYDLAAIVRLSLINALESATATAQRWSEFDYIAPRERDLERRDDFLALANQLNEAQDLIWTINQRLRDLDDAWRNYRALVAEGDRIQAEREIFRQRSAALVQGFRTRDAAFRIFRNEKLERYKTLFDLAARYSFLAANAYDYETGLLNTPQGKEFVNRVISSRALGVVEDGNPQFAGSNTGDPGLSSILAEMKADFDVLKGRLGFNNPSSYGTTVSLRTERERIIPAADGDIDWRDVMQRGFRPNLLDDGDVRRYCMQIDRGNGLPVPGIILEFSTTIEDGMNLFGQSLAGGDHYFDSSHFATKIFSVGVALEGYVGMDSPVANSVAVSAAGGFSPPDPATSFLGARSLAATPGVYLIPVGVDSMRSPALGDASGVRSWSVNDVAIPLPFNIGGSDFSTQARWRSHQSLSEPLFAVRKHAAFRPVPTAAAFSSSINNGGGGLLWSQFTNNRLIGRSVWNSKWKLVIPGHKLLGDPLEGLERFMETVKDVKLHFVTYSYAGN